MTELNGFTNLKKKKMKGKRMRNTITRIKNVDTIMKFFPKNCKCLKKGFGV